MADKVSDSIFYELEKSMANRHIPLEEQYQVYNKLIEEYWSYSFDSTLVFINRNTAVAKSLNNIGWVNKCNLSLSFLFASSGRFKEAQDVLGNIDKRYLDTTLTIDYYNCYRKVYSDLHYYALQPISRISYGDLYKAYTDSVAPLITEAEDDYLYAQEWQLLDQKKFEECLKINSLRLAKALLPSEKYSYITFQRSMIYERMGDKLMEKKYLALSAISDIQAARKDNASLAKLASYTYDEGDVDKAYEYIKYSFEDAIFYNSKLRFVEIANSFSLIMDSHQIQTNRQKDALIAFTVIVSLLSLVLFALLYFVYKQNKTLQKAKDELHKVNEQYRAVNKSLEETMVALKLSYHNLAEANHIKELYIGHFMNICSNFIDKLDKYRLTVNKMLSAKKYQQLFNMTRTAETIEQEIEEFYATFDKTFLELYPSFVDELNDLLHTEERIELKKHETLNPELRIFAVIRLGIKDSARIAQLLRYSVNTIYNYRVKVKNKAKDREKFEDCVLQIGTFKDIQ